MNRPEQFLPSISKAPEGRPVYSRHAILEFSSPSGAQSVPWLAIITPRWGWEDVPRPECYKQDVPPGLEPRHNDPGTSGHPTDEPGVQNVARSSPDLRPCPGGNARHYRAWWTCRHGGRAMLVTPVRM